MGDTQRMVVWVFGISVSLTLSYFGLIAPAAVRSSYEERIRAVQSEPATPGDPASDQFETAIVRINEVTALVRQRDEDPKAQSSPASGTLVPILILCACALITARQLPAFHVTAVTRVAERWSVLVLRSLACLIDTIVVQVGTTLIVVSYSVSNPMRREEQAAAILGLGLFANWLYSALSESSLWQATLGKRLLGVEVSDLKSQRITFARASVRFFSKFLSALPFGIGFMAAAFSPLGQAWHDQIAETIVSRRRQ